MSEFVRITTKYGCKLKSGDREKLLKSFPSDRESIEPMFSIARIFDNKYNLLNQKFYKKVDVSDI